MAELKAGTKLKSAVCDTQVVVIRAIAGAHELTCGGAAMVSPADPGTGTIDPGQADGTSVGKRYVNADDSFEALAVKGGAGSLYLGGVRLELKQAKALPSSD